MPQQQLLPTEARPHRVSLEVTDHSLDLLDAITVDVRYAGLDEDLRLLGRVRFAGMTCDRIPTLVEEVVHAWTFSANPRKAIAHVMRSTQRRVDRERRDWENEAITYP